MKFKQQIVIDPIKTVCSVICHGFALQIILTSWAIVSLAGGGLAKVQEMEERQAEKEKSRLSHPQQRDLR